MAKGNFVLPYDWIFFNQLETHCTFGSLLLRGLLKVKYSQNVCLTTPINSLGYSEWSVLDFLEPSTKKYTEGFLVSIAKMCQIINTFLIMYRFCGILWDFHVVVWPPLGLLDIQSKFDFHESRSHIDIFFYSHIIIVVVTVKTIFGLTV